MKTTHELRAQLMQMKQTLQDLKAYNEAHLEYNLFDELKRLRMDIMMHATNYFIKQLDEKERS